MIIYVLRCLDDKYYVGKTERGYDRIIEHFLAEGSEWTHRYQPIEIIEKVEGAHKFDEDKYTLIYMEKYGIENVRGGSWCKLELSHDETKEIKRKINGANDKCYNCGGSNHFVRECPLERGIPWCKICEKEGHYIEECSFLRQVSDFFAPKEIICYRCGRKGHIKPKCYAKTHVKGYQLKY